MLNASGGLEKGKADDYAISLNDTAPIANGEAGVAANAAGRTHGVCDQPLGALLGTEARACRV